MRLLVVAVAVLCEVVAVPATRCEVEALVLPATRCEVVPCGARADVVPCGALLCLSRLFGDAASVAVRVERMSLALRMEGLRCEKERWGLAAA